MMDDEQKREKTELEKRSVLRLSNEESNRITRECILTALLLLMQEKPFEKITITELVKRSGVSRMAFYRNFTSKQDVLKEMGDQLYAGCVSLINKYGSDPSPYRFYEEVLRLVEREKDNLDLLRNAGLKVHDLLDLTKVLLTKYMPEDQATRYLHVSWWSALEGIIVAWYEYGMEESVESMTKLCCELLPTIPALRLAEA